MNILGMGAQTTFAKSMWQLTKVSSVYKLDGMNLENHL